MSAAVDAWRDRAHQVYAGDDAGFKVTGRGAGAAASLAIITGGGIIAMVAELEADELEQLAQAAIGAAAALRTARLASANVVAFQRRAP